jgi:pilus assembly protein Flp/PilA
MIFNLTPKAERGQGLVEYALLIILIAMVVMITLSAIPPPVENIFYSIGNTLAVQ